MIGRCVSTPPLWLRTDDPEDDVTTSRDRYESALINGRGPHVLSQGVSKRWRSAVRRSPVSLETNSGAAAAAAADSYRHQSSSPAAGRPVHERNLCGGAICWRGGAIWFRGCGDGEASRCDRRCFVGSRPRNARAAVCRLESADLRLSTTAEGSASTGTFGDR